MALKWEKFYDDDIGWNILRFAYVPGGRLFRYECYPQPALVWFVPDTKGGSHGVA